MSASSASWLITGATGFLGRHVVDAIGRRAPGAPIMALVRDARRARGAPELEHLRGVELIEGSPLDVDSWKDDPRVADLRGIYHLAAEVKHSRSDTAGMMRLNVEGTTAMVRVAAAKKCRLLFASTSGTVGCSTNPDYAPDEQAPYCESVVRDWPYYLSKIRAEKGARALAGDLGADLVILRPPVLLGPGDHRFRSTGNVLRVLQDRLPFILEGGMHFVDVRDAADAMVRAMNHPSPQPVYNLAGTASTLDQFFRLVAGHAGKSPSWKVLPARFLWYAARLNEMIGRPLHVLPDPVVIEMAGHYWGISSRYAERDLGYQSRDPDQTVADTIAWIRRETSREHISG